jgi:hypothetical protein
MPLIRHALWLKTPLGRGVGTPRPFAGLPRPHRKPSLTTCPRLTALRAAILGPDGLGGPQAA